MRSVLGTAAYAVSLILALACFTGCMRLDDGTDDQKKPGGVPYATTEPMPTSASYKFALVVVSKSMELNGCSVTYPFVCDQNSEMLNVAIHAAFAEFADYCDSPGSSITYTTEFNRYGLLSFLMTCTSEDGRQLAADTANFDCGSIRRIYLPSCFGSDKQFEARLGEIVLREAVAAGGELLTGLPPMDESRLFVFTLGGLCLFYREYELFPTGGGLMRIRIGLEELEGCIAPDGLLTRLG